MTDFIDLKDVDVIAPNFKKRLSGVTSTIIQLVPIQRQFGVKIAVCGWGLPSSLPHVRFKNFWRLWQKTKTGNYRVWHARRNIEMLPGIIMRDVLRMRLKLTFTSASQREHTRYTKWLISKMDSVIATSKKTAQYLEVPNTVIMHGIDLQRFCPPKDKSEQKRKLGLDETKRIVGCFGRIRKQKGTDLFVDAMIELLPQHPDWIAIIAGRATSEHIKFEQNLKSKIADAKLADRILFVGEHTSIEQWYQALDLYIAPQRWEGFGLTPLEAAACAVPVIATDVGAFSELIVENKTGVITLTDDLDSMVDAAGKLLPNTGKIHQFGENARQHVELNFSLKKEAIALQKEYEGLPEK